MTAEHVSLSWCTSTRALHFQLVGGVSALTRDFIQYIHGNTRLAGVRAEGPNTSAPTPKPLSPKPRIGVCRIFRSQASGHVSNP